LICKALILTLKQATSTPWWRRRRWGTRNGSSCIRAGETERPMLALDVDNDDSRGSRRQALEVLETRRGCLPVSTEVLPDNSEKQGL